MKSRIAPFDLMCTATLRPELLKRTFDSHITGLFKHHINRANLIINIDKVGSDEPENALDEIFSYIESIPFHRITVNISDNPMFSKAFCWCINQLTADFTFNLEEDWELSKWFDFEEMLELFDDSDLMHLRLSQFKSDGSDTMKTWNKFITWNGDYFEVPPNLRGLLGFAGHPSLNRTALFNYFRPILNPLSNPEKQMKGKHPILLNSKFGVFHPKKATPPSIRDIGRDWMKDNGYQKKGIKAFFTEWEKI